MNTGDTAFMLIATALVFFMTPGLAFFYGGLVRRKNVCNTMMACVAIMGLSVVLWTLFGYSLAFGGNHGGIIGDFRWIALNGVDWEAGPYADTIPHLVFCAFQMMFAMITPALITGSLVGRMKFKALFLFVTLWSFVVYYPLAHMVWGEGGLLAAIGSVDFAGGDVVHISSGVSALVLAIILGRRRGYEQVTYRIHNIPFVVLGASLLWFGWFGFNEFDYRSKGLAQMLDTAAASGDVVPSLLVCNVDWSEMNDERQLLKDAFDHYGVKDYEVIEKGGVKIALLGVFGKDSLSCAPTCALEFKDPIEAVKETVATIKEKEDVDMIVCLSHSGTSEDPKKSEDELLAKAVPELDVIISGHTHTTLEEPIIQGNTAIVSAGEYGINVGTMHLAQNKEGRWEVEDYKLIPIRPDIEADEAAQEKIDTFEANIDEVYLKQFGYTASEVLCENEYEFASVDDLYEEHTEHNLGDLMADAYIYGATHTKDYDGEEIDVAVVPSGTVRDTYVPGDVTVTDVFNSFSLGIGADGVPGYPLIKVYLTGKELKTVAEIDASISDYMTTARLYCSGLNMTYNPNRLILNRVTDVYLTKDDKREEIEDDKLYCVVADLYSGQMLSAVTDMSYGLLSIVPKNADGSKVEDFEDCIIYDGDQELKAWVSIARYMESFEEGENGIAEMPEYYNGLHDRKVVDDDKSLGARLKNPNKYAAMIVGVVLVVLLVLIFIIVLIVKVIRRIRRRKLKKS